MRKRFFITVSGIVQGVGFRPFVYNLANSCNLKGWVNNNSEGVYIDVEGEEEDLCNFTCYLKNNPPPLSHIENIVVENKTLVNYMQFDIKESEANNSSITLISPDIALCDECRVEILDPKNRRYGYPFTNCTNCGPRFSIIKSIPYDRDKTTMKNFKMCSSCSQEYKDPSNRRFHAQPNACKDCGPHIWITDSLGNNVKTNYETAKFDGQGSIEIIKWAVSKLKEGKIFAIKGLTGFHLCCSAENEYAIRLLRERKKRPHKPLAVMMKNIDTVKRYCEVNKLEENLLSGIKKPIVLLNKKQEFLLPEILAPNQKTLGVMLPYTPLHELIFNEDVKVLIMTSANYYGLPLEYDNKMAVEHLSDIADYFLMHDRDIYIPVDDSVVRVIDNEERIIRRARGYAPSPVTYDGIEEILACGPNMKNTFSIGKDNFVFLSQHNGDLENLETMEHFKRNIEHFKTFFSFSPKYIALDMHPGYVSTQYSDEYDLTKIEVQHHHAHIASCMAENKIRNKVIGVSYDGTGYGTDGRIWGGEFLLCDLMSFNRLAHLDYVKLPGGEKAIKEPWRTAVSYIYKAYQDGLILENQYRKMLIDLYGEESMKIVEILKRGINSPETSSMGRFFDAVSSILNINQKVTYEGQASIELEAAIEGNTDDFYTNVIEKKDGCFIINTSNIIVSILKDKDLGIPISSISTKFHNTVVNFTYELCIGIRNQLSINDVVLSGGVFQNSYLLEKLINVLRKNKFNVYSHKQIPSNDGGISLGQIIVANEIIKHSQL